MQILDKRGNVNKDSKKQQRKELEDQHWYHGLLSREDIELGFLNFENIVPIMNMQLFNMKLKCRTMFYWLKILKLSESVTISVSFGNDRTLDNSLPLAYEV